MLNFFRKSKPPVQVNQRKRPRVGIITQYATRKGHTTLSKCIEFALGNTPSVFSIRKLSRLNEEVLSVKSHPVEACLVHDRVVPPRTQLRDWLKNQDIIVIVERATPKLFELCKEQGIRCVVVPMIDWLPDDPTERQNGLKAADLVVTLTEQAAGVLEHDGLDNVRYIPASLYWQIPPPRPARKSRIFYFNIGVGGPLNRRNVPMVLEIFNKLLEKHKHARLVMKMVPKARKYLGDLGPLHPSIELIERSMSGDEMRELQRSADVSLFPTRFEGLGFPLLESLHSGVPVITTGAPPMNEFITHEKNGLLIKAKHAGLFGGQGIWDLDKDDFEGHVDRLMSLENQDFLDSLTQNTLDGIGKRQEAWIQIWQKHFEKLSPFVVNLGAGENQIPGACNLDRRPLPGIDVVADAKQLPFADNSVDELIANGLLEHFPVSETEDLLDEWTRVLKPGGKIRIETPDLKELCRQFYKGKLSVDSLVSSLYGEEGDSENSHKSGFDEDKLRSLLKSKGIQKIERVTEEVSPDRLCMVGRRAR